jgi:hypothetical protein
MVRSGNGHLLTSPSLQNALPSSFPPATQNPWRMMDPPARISQLMDNTRCSMSNAKGSISQPPFLQRIVPANTRRRCWLCPQALFVSGATAFRGRTPRPLRSMEGRVGKLQS